MSEINSLQLEKLSTDLHDMYNHLLIIIYVLIGVLSTLFSCSFYFVYRQFKIVTKQNDEMHENLLKYNNLEDLNEKTDLI